MFKEQKLAKKVRRLSIRGPHLYVAYYNKNHTIINLYKKYGQYGDRTRDIRVISTTL